MRIKIEKSFQVPVWDEAAKLKAVDFWLRRRVTFSQISENVLVGRRGSLLGNLTSFDMSKLMTKLIITISARQEVQCVLDVNTIMQQITQFNQAWWQLEMSSFESFLLKDDEQEENWEQFKARYKQAAWAWSLSLGLRGDKMPPEDRP